MSEGPVRFAPGDIVYLRHFQRESISAIFEVHVVTHDQAGLLLWSGTGERYWLWNMPDGRRMRETPLAEWSTTTEKLCVPYRTRHAMLSWHPAGADYSIRLFFAADGTFMNWYANLELPAVAWRTPEFCGVDTVDWDLDVWIAPDRTWRWKDEEEFADRLRSPEHYWVSDEARVRAAGHEVIKLVEAADFPFDGSLLDFHPDPGWADPFPPEAVSPPPGWDHPRTC